MAREPGPITCVAYNRTPSSFLGTLRYPESQVGPKAWAVTAAPSCHTSSVPRNAEVLARRSKSDPAGRIVWGVFGEMTKAQRPGRSACGVEPLKGEDRAWLPDPIYESGK